MRHAPAGDPRPAAAVSRGHALDACVAPAVDSAISASPAIADGRVASTCVITLINGDETLALGGTPRDRHHGAEPCQLLSAHP